MQVQLQKFEDLGKSLHLQNDKYLGFEMLNIAEMEQSLNSHSVISGCDDLISYISHICD